MKILYFYQYFTTPKGSWSTRVYEFGRRWAKAGDTVIVVTSIYDKSDLEPSGLTSRVEIDGIDVRVINVKLSNKHGILVRLLSFAWYALISCWYALTISADVVIASSGPITVGLPGLVARHLRRRRFVFEVRDLWPEGAIQLGKLKGSLFVALARWFEKICYRSSDHVIALSDGMAEDIERRFPGTRITVVPNSCDIELFSTAKDTAAPCGPKTVVYTGTLGAMDDCGQILDAAAVLEARGRRDIALTFLGDGAERAMLETRALETGLDRVSFAGLLPKLEVVHWLKNATCALVVFRNVPVLSTCSPNKFFDALAAGVPVVQNTQGWIKGLLHESCCGLTVPQNDPEAMADAIEALCDSQELRDRMAENARRVARERYDRDLLAQRMRQVLQDVVDS